MLSGQVVWERSVCFHFMKHVACRLCACRLVSCVSFVLSPLDRSSSRVFVVVIRDGCVMQVSAVVGEHPHAYLRRQRHGEAGDGFGQSRTGRFGGGAQDCWDLKGRKQ